MGWHVCLLCCVDLTNHQHMFRKHLSPFVLIWLHSRANIAALIAIHKRSACQVGFWELGFQKGFHHSLTGKECLNCSHKQWGLCSTFAFLLGVWNFATSQAEGIPTWPATSENFGCWVFRELPWWHRFTLLWHLSLGDLSTSCVVHEERTLESMHLAFFGFCPPCLSLALLLLYMLSL